MRWVKQWRDGTWFGVISWGISWWAEGVGGDTRWQEVDASPYGTTRDECGHDGTDKYRHKMAENGKNRSKRGMRFE